MFYRVRQCAGPRLRRGVQVMACFILPTHPGRTSRNGATLDFPDPNHAGAYIEGILIEGGSLLTGLNRLIRSAAFAADCIAAVFYTVTNGKAQLAASFDTLGYLRLKPDWWPAAEAAIPPRR